MVRELFNPKLRLLTSALIFLWAWQHQFSALGAGQAASHILGSEARVKPGLHFRMLQAAHDLRGLLTGLSTQTSA